MNNLQHLAIVVGLCVVQITGVPRIHAQVALDRTPLTDSVRATRLNRLSRILPELRDKPGSAYFVDILLSEGETERIIEIMDAYTESETKRIPLSEWYKLSDAQVIAYERERAKRLQALLRPLLMTTQQEIFDRNVIWAEKDYEARLQRLVPRSASPLRIMRPRQ